MRGEGFIFHDLWRYEDWACGEFMRFGNRVWVGRWLTDLGRLDCEMFNA